MILWVSKYAHIVIMCVRVCVYMRFWYSICAHIVCIRVFMCIHMCVWVYLYAQIEGRSVFVYLRVSVYVRAHYVYVCVRVLLCACGCVCARTGTRVQMCVCVLSKCLRGLLLSLSLSFSLSCARALSLSPNRSFSGSLALSLSLSEILLKRGESLTYFLWKDSFMNVPWLIFVFCKTYETLTAAWIYRSLAHALCLFLSRACARVRAHSDSLSVSCFLFQKQLYYVRDWSTISVVACINTRKHIYSDSCMCTGTYALIGPMRTSVDRQTPNTYATHTHIHKTDKK